MGKRREPRVGEVWQSSPMDGFTVWKHILVVREMHVCYELICGRLCLMDIDEFMTCNQRAKRIKSWDELVNG